MSGGSRVSIPDKVRETIQDIKEIAWKHSDDDIYAMLKECNMDPNETAQRLLYLDTFHEVKRKRERRKVNVSSRASEEFRWTPGTQGRGARGGRGNYSSPYISHDAVGERNMSARKENGANNLTERGFRSSLPVLQKSENNLTPCVTKSSTVSINGPTSLSNGSSSHGCAPQLSAGNISNLPKDSSVVGVKKVGTVSPLPTVAMKQPPTSTSAPTPTPTFAHGIGVEQGKSTSSSNHLPTCTTSASVSGVYSSASDPVLVPSFNSRIPGAVGTIKREVGSQRIAAESSATILAGSRSISAHDVANNIQAASGVANSTNRTRPIKSQEIGKSQLSEPSQPSSLPTHDGSLSVISNQDSWSPQQLIGSSKVVASEAATMAVEASSQSLPELYVSAFEEETSKLDKKLEGLNISVHPPVIFPDHIQVPDTHKNGLTFGSLDVTFGQSIKYINAPDGGKGSAPAVESIQGNDEAAREPSPSNQSVSSTAQEGDYPDHSRSPPHVPENLSPLEDNVSAGAVPKYDQAKQEMMLPLGGPQYPLVQTGPNYTYAFGPPVPGSQLVQFEGLEPQACDISCPSDFVSGNPLVLSTSGSTPPATQSAGGGQSSIAVSPQPVHVFRQPYPPNYFTYDPYFPGYLPHYLHQFLGHSGFPQQPSTGNIYLPPAAAAPGVKSSVPQCKPGTNAGNPTPLGLPSGYGSYNSSPVGYNPSSAMISGSSTGNEDLAASELKENNIYTTVQQSDGSLVWFPPSGRDMSSLQANSFYNFHLGQHVTFSPAQAGHGAFAGVYHPAQTVAAPSTAHPQLQQSQAMAGSVETVGPPSGAYQQPLHALNWSPNY